MPDPILKFVADLRAMDAELARLAGEESAYTRLHDGRAARLDAIETLAAQIAPRRAWLDQAQQFLGAAPPTAQAETNGAAPPPRYTLHPGKVAAVEAALRGGASYRAAAAGQGISFSSAAKIARAIGMANTSQPGRPTRPRAATVAALAREARRLRAEGHGISEVARRTGVSWNKAKRLVEGAPTRHATTPEQREIAAAALRAGAGPAAAARAAGLTPGVAARLARKIGIPADPLAQALGRKWGGFRKSAPGTPQAAAAPVEAAS